MPAASENYNPRYTFKNFIVKPGNQEAYSVISSIPEKPVESVFLYGESGSGKTYLMISLTRHLLEKNPSLSVIYISMQDFLKVFVRSLRTGTIERFHVKYRKADYLFIDDIDVLEGKPETQKEVINILNSRLNYGKTTIISCTTDAENVNLLIKLRSRLKWGHVISINV